LVETDSATTSDKQGILHFLVYTHFSNTFLLDWYSSPNNPMYVFYLKCYRGKQLNGETVAISGNIFSLLHTGTFT